MDSIGITRDDLLGGLPPTRRANTLFHLIAARTAYRVQTSRRAASRVASALTPEESGRDYLKAFSQSRDLEDLPTIQQMERYAPEWARLLPDDNPDLLATVAHIIGEEYEFTAERIPLIREALQIDAPATQQAYQGFYDRPIDGIYADRLPVLEQVKWAFSQLTYKIESLPPFWAAYSLTLTETVGASILALPIALALIGPLAGVGLLLILGLVNILTMAGFTEAITRSGVMRYGNMYLGGLVRAYLGNVGSLLLTSSLLILIVILIPVYYIGISSTLEAVTDIPETIWVVLIFLVGLYFARGKSLDSTIASAILIGAVNITIILFISFLALGQADPTNLRYVNVPFVNGAPFEAKVLELVFGIGLASFFGHTSAANVAKTVLKQNPDGKALIWGNVAALATAMVIYSLWVIAVNGAISPDALQDVRGTALEPLAEVVGRGILIPGTVYVVLGMGLASIHYLLALSNQIREWISSSSALASRGSRWIVLLPLTLPFIVTEYLLVTNQDSFAGLLSFVAVITIPIIAGIFPILLVTASRRRGEFLAGGHLKLAGNPLVNVILFVIFLASIVVHGVFIWESLWLRLVAAAVSLIILAIVFLIINGGAFRKQAIIEIRTDDSISDTAAFSVVDAGVPGKAVVTAAYDSGEHETIDLTSGTIPKISRVKQLVINPEFTSEDFKVWLHNVDDNDQSEPIGAEISVVANGLSELIDIDKVMPLQADAVIKIDLLK